jgi:hypothetical protein
MTDITQEDINEIELSMSFGDRLVEYRSRCIDAMLERRADDTPNIRQVYEKDRAVIAEIIRSLETKDEIETCYPLKKRLSVVAQNYFSKEFRKLKELNL